MVIFKWILSTSTLLCNVQSTMGKTCLYSVLEPVSASCKNDANDTMYTIV